ncbi:hypothetical protein [Thermodesulforhabdus norvegica]|uniref:Uncharacterized protein n=1 Tax=Thermodesulforhabdus norvegica TaxID=39841 RepID=A0A1I4RH91_9BACT|nr:hypothetical protein [Thermodesulforhabdus norvegica]SFM51611.1 hypothetical protein SAMN05660836_00619 [Thermodesulforhabdus norvegica]
MEKNREDRFKTYGRRPDPLLEDFFDPEIPLPDICWETVPHSVNPYLVWEAYDENVHGWVFLWYPTRDRITGRSYGEFERAQYFHNDLVRILKEMHRWPLWGTRKHRKHTLAFALLQLYAEVSDLWWCAV